VGFFKRRCRIGKAKGRVKRERRGFWGNENVTGIEGIKWIRKISGCQET